MLIKELLNLIYLNTATYEDFQLTVGNQNYTTETEDLLKRLFAGYTNWFLIKDETEGNQGKSYYYNLTNGEVSPLYTHLTLNSGISYTGSRVKNIVDTPYSDPRNYDTNPVLSALDTGFFHTLLKKHQRLVLNPPTEAYPYGYWENTDTNEIFGYVAPPQFSALNYTNLPTSPETFTIPTYSSSTVNSLIDSHLTFSKDYDVYAFSDIRNFLKYYERYGLEGWYKSYTKGDQTFDTLHWVNINPLYESFECHNNVNYIPQSSQLVSDILTTINYDLPIRMYDQIFLADLPNYQLYYTKLYEWKNWKKILENGNPYWYNTLTTSKILSATKNGADLISDSSSIVVDSGTSTSTNTGQDLLVDANGNPIIDNPVDLGNVRRKLVIDSNIPVMYIGKHTISANAAIQPKNYLTELYFHSSLHYLTYQQHVISVANLRLLAVPFDYYMITITGDEVGGKKGKKAEDPPNVYVYVIIPKAYTRVYLLGQAGIRATSIYVLSIDGVSYPNGYIEQDGNHFRHLKVAYDPVSNNVYLVETGLTYWQYYQYSEGYSPITPSWYMLETYQTLIQNIKVYSID